MKQRMIRMALWGLMMWNVPMMPATANEAAAGAPDLKRKIREWRQADEGRSRDRVAIGRDLTVAKDEVVPDAVVVLGSADIQGEVTRDLVVVFGSAKLGPEAYVKGNAVVIGGSLDLDPEARIRGDRVVIGIGSLGSWGLGWMQDWFHQGFMKGRPVTPSLPWMWGLLALLSLLYAGLVVTFPATTARCVDTLVARPIPSFFSGLLAAMLLGPLVMLLIITVAGIVVIPFLGCGIFGAFVLGKAVVGRAVGGRVMGLPSHETRVGYAVGAALLGTGLLFALYTVPLLGFVAWGLVTPLGFGAVVITLLDQWTGRKDRSSSPQSGSPVTGSPVAAPAMALEVSSVSRATIGQRLVALLIDVVICGVLGRFLNFGMAWLVYHAAFWGWKGTTLGGMVMNLKGIRIDGKPMDFSVGAVRALASILSCVVLGLGYLWALWDPEGRTWHDKISGTIVVKAPNGVSLI